MLPGSKATHSLFVHSILRCHFHAEYERKNPKAKIFSKQPIVTALPFPFARPLNNVSDQAPTAEMDSTTERPRAAAGLESRDAEGAPIFRAMNRRGGGRRQHPLRPPITPRPTQPAIGPNFTSPQKPSEFPNEQIKLSKRAKSRRCALSEIGFQDLAKLPLWHRN